MTAAECPCCLQAVDDDAEVIHIAYDHPRIWRALFTDCADAYIPFNVLAAEELATRTGP